MTDNPYTVTSDDPSRDQAWSELCADLAVQNWNALDFQTHYAMFLHGWEARQNLQYRRDRIRINAEFEAEIAAAEATAVAVSAEPAWAKMDPVFLVEFVRQETAFDADMIERMLTFAIDAAKPAQPKPQGSVH